MVLITLLECAGIQSIKQYANAAICLGEWVCNACNWPFNHTTDYMTHKQPVQSLLMDLERVFKSL